MEIDESKKSKQTIGTKKPMRKVKNALDVFSPSKTIIGAAALMMVAVLLTKFFGFLRLALMGSIIDPKGLLLFNAANTIPEVIFNIIALGSINSAIIPTITKAFEKKGKEQVNETMSSVLNLGVLLFIVCAVIVFVLAMPIAYLLVGTNRNNHFSAEDIEKMSSMIRILTLSPIILALSSTLASLLQIQRKFFITQIAPLFYNFGIIISIYTFVPMMHGDPIGLCYGVILGSILHLLCELPSFKGTGYKFKLGYINLKDKFIKEIGILMIPRSMGLAAEQAAFLIQTSLALSLFDNSLNIYKFALSLRDIPISFFGMTLSQAVFPSLSEDANKETFDDFNEKLRYTFQQIFFLVIPATVFFIVLRLPIVRITYGIFKGHFTFDIINRISWVLLFLSFTIIFQSLLNLLVRSYYALSNTFIPFIVSIMVIVIETILSFVFIYIFQNIFNNSIGAVAGLALASTIAGAIGVITLIIMLNNKCNFIDKKMYISFSKKIMSGMIMAVCMYLSYKFIDYFIDSSKSVGLILIFVLCFVIGLSSYLASEYNLLDDDMKLTAKFFYKFRSALKFIKRKKSEIQNTISNL